MNFPSCPALVIVISCQKSKSVNLTGAQCNRSCDSVVTTGRLNNQIQHSGYKSAHNLNAYSHVIVVRRNVEGGREHETCVT